MPPARTSLGNAVAAVRGRLLSAAFTVLVTVEIHMPHLVRLTPIRRSLAWMFGEALSRSYDRIVETYPTDYGLPAKRLLAHLASIGGIAGEEGLEVGVGTGFFTCRLARALPGLRLTATDLSESMLAQARARLEREGLAAHTMRADSAALPFADGRFGAVFAHNTFVFLEEFRRVCRPGGRIALMDSSCRHLGPIVGARVRRSKTLRVVASERLASGSWVLLECR